MTILNITLTPRAAWLASDTLITRSPEGMVLPPAFTTTDPEVARAADVGLCLAGAQEAGHARKFAVFERSRAASGGYGHVEPQMLWLETMRQADLEEVEQIVDDAPGALAQIAAALEERGGYVPSFSIVVLGWSRRQGRALGWSFASGDGFKATPLPDGHSFMPTAEATPAEFPRLDRLWTLAERGQAIEAFHRALARHPGPLLPRGQGLERQQRHRRHALAGRGERGGGQVPGAGGGVGGS